MLFFPFLFFLFFFHIFYYGEAEMLFSKDFELLLKLWTYAFAFSSSGTNNNGYK